MYEAWTSRNELLTDGLETYTHWNKTKDNETLAVIWTFANPDTEAEVKVYGTIGNEKNITTNKIKLEILMQHSFLDEMLCTEQSKERFELVARLQELPNV